MIADACVTLDDSVVVVSIASQRIAILLTIAAVVGLLMYAIAAITRDPGPPPRGKS